ncbi:MAG: DUF2892 domain-containing protein [SAR202 cluster bacterium]|nr:DUF2892 domain-containing protein [SAR202 cluster bacterium]
MTLSKPMKQRLRHVAVVGIAIAFPLLYVGAVSLGGAGLTAAALAVTGIVCVLAALAF